MFRGLVLSLIVATSGQVALAVDGGIISVWGYGGEGLTTLPQPNNDFISVAAGLYHNLALRDADSNGLGEIVAWGRNSDGQCSVPPPNMSFIAVAAGSYHSLGLRADGSVVAWGQNNQGQCNIPAPNSNFIAIAAGDSHSLGLKSDGSIVGWGYNGNSQTSVPVPNSGFTHVAAGGQHSLGLKVGGVALAWGYNGYGQCNIPSPNSGFVGISGGFYHSLGVKSDGSIIAWGNNSYGQLNVPQPNSGFIGVAAGANHSLGLKAGGAIIAWGRNDQGQCSPLSDTNYLAVTAGGDHGISISASGPFPTVILVDDSTTNGAPDGLTWETAFPDLEQALNVGGGSNLLREIWVAAGTYVPSFNSNRSSSFHLRSQLSILGGFAGNETEASQRDPAANVTILSGDINRDDFFGFIVDNSYHVVTATAVASTAVLDGFTITAGNGSGAADSRGTLIYINNSSPTIMNCILTNSLSGRAMFTGGNSSSLIQECVFLSNDFGAVTNSLSGPQILTFDGCSFIDNRAAEGGAAIRDDCASGSPTIVVRNCTFDDNWTSSFTNGGGIYNCNQNSLLVENCTLSNNFGGAVYCTGSSSTNTVRLIDSVFSGNVSFDYGGGLANLYCCGALPAVTVQRCHFIDNFASSAGGALYLQGNSSEASARIENSVFNANTSYSGGAIYVSGYAEILNSTIAHNEAQDAGGLYKQGSGLVINNSILWHNQANSGSVQSAQLTYTGSTPTVNYTNLENLDIISFGPGNIDEEPQFVSATDLHLAAGSPCIDAGANQIVPPGTDADGNPRFFDDPTVIDTGLGTPPIVDMGAHEYRPLVNPNDADNDGIANASDNCPQVYNPSQDDFDDDGQGDVCDGDIDNDSVLNPADACDFTPVGSYVQPDGSLRADLDGDCDVDTVDFSIMQSEFTGPN